MNNNSNQLDDELREQEAFFARQRASGEQPAAKVLRAPVSAARRDDRSESERDVVVLGPAGGLMKAMSSARSQLGNSPAAAAAAAAAAAVAVPGKKRSLFAKLHGTKPSSSVQTTSAGGVESQSSATNDEVVASKAADEMNRELMRQTQSDISTAISAFSDNERREGKVEKTGNEMWNAERDSISKENEMYLSSMSEEDIAEQQRQLLANLSPELLARFGQQQQNMNNAGDGEKKNKKKPERHVSFGGVEHFGSDEDGDEGDEGDGEQPDIGFTDENAELARRFHAAITGIDSPELGDDPFIKHLADMRRKYYGDVPVEDDKLSWMAPLLPRERQSTFNSTSAASNTEGDSFAAEAAKMRFDFKGGIIEEDADIPTHFGLHHHGLEPNRAGYTINELGIIGRSKVPAQRVPALRALAAIAHGINAQYYHPAAQRLALYDLFLSERIIECAAIALDTSHLTSLVAAVDVLHTFLVGGELYSVHSSTASQQKDQGEQERLTSVETAAVGLLHSAGLVRLAETAAVDDPDHAHALRKRTTEIFRVVTKIHPKAIEHLLKNPILRKLVPSDSWR